MSEKYCDSCGHSLKRHYKDVENNIQCNVVESGTSTRGVIGLPYRNECDCENYQSKIGQYRKAKKKQEEEEDERQLQRIIGIAKKKLNDLKPSK